MPILSSGKQTTQRRSRHLPAIVVGLLFALALLASTPCTRADDAAPIVAFSDLTFVDTSGEPQDQRNVHAARLSSFNAGLVNDLARPGKYRILRLSCDANPCKDDNASSALAADARRAGARYLVIGGIHKMSTLVGWAKVQMIDLREDKIVLDKLLSFRGDTDEAWRRAEGFLAREIAGIDLSK
jgi:hypothetical protein